MPDRFDPAGTRLSAKVAVKIPANRLLVSL